MKNYIKIIVLMLASVSLISCQGKGGGSGVAIGNGTNQYVTANGTVANDFINQMVYGEYVYTFNFPVSSINSAMDSKVLELKFPAGTTQSYQISQVQNIDLYVDFNFDAHPDVNFDQNYINSYRGEFRVLMEIADAYTDTYNQTKYIHIAFAEGQVTAASYNGSQLEMTMNDGVRNVRFRYNTSSGATEIYYTVPGKAEQSLITGYSY
ncbi:MAG: hypothetical protein VX642_01505 [Bdellovibrionota bacterium]|nr:hypothetical protein [Bdellovibrionota bacterium]